MTSTIFPASRCLRTFGRLNSLAWIMTVCFSGLSALWAFTSSGSGFLLGLLGVRHHLLSRAVAGRVAGCCRLPIVGVAGFVHVHVNGVNVPYTRRREARAQRRARSLPVTIGGRVVCGPRGPPVAAPDLHRAAGFGVLL